MIIVNTPGNHETTFAPLLHATWNGFTPTDWVFPTFMFVVGNAMSFSLAKYSEKGNVAFFKKIFYRSAVIFLLGYLMYWFPFFHESEGTIVFNPISETRIFGVLQRIALGYFFASIILHFWKIKGAILFSIVALLGYWGLLSYFGDYTLLGNAVLKLDLALFGSNHLYHGEGVAFDPEGLLSTLPSIVNVICGYIVGMFIREKGNTFETISKLMIAGTIFLFVALSWDMVFPINKKLWTSSYVLFTVGLDLLILPIILFVIEINKIKRWAYFFEVLGKNTLFIYLLSEVGIVFFWIFNVENVSLYGWLYQNVFRLVGEYFGSLLFAVSWLLTCWLIGYWMDKKKIYIKV